MPPALTHRSMAPVQEVHLYLHEVPMIFVLMIQQPVEVAHIAMIRESQVLDTSGLALLQQEVEDAIIQKAPLQRLHATADAVQQVVVDIVHLQTFERLFVHALRVVVTPQTPVLVRHLCGHMVRLTRETAQCITRQHLRATTHIHQCRVEVVHTVCNGIVHQLVHLTLIIGQAHHAEAQQRDLLTRAVLHAIRHLVIGCGIP